MRDLAADPVHHLDGERFSAFLSKPANAPVAQQAVVDYSDALIEELKAADVVDGCVSTISAFPSTLKAHFDHIAGQECLQLCPRSEGVVARQEGLRHGDSRRPPCRNSP